MDNWGEALASNSTEALDFQCADETGDCGPCHTGYTGLRCDFCADDFEYIVDANNQTQDGQFVICRKCSQNTS